MDQALQDKFRNDIVEKNLKNGWECLANYAYWGQKYAALEKQLDEYETRIKHFENVIEELQKQPDAHTVEVREKVKIAREDIKAYKKRSEAMQPTAKKFFETSVKWREDGTIYLEVADHCRTFKVKTPEEIEADKTGMVKEDIKPAEEPKP